MSWTVPQLPAQCGYFFCGGEMTVCKAGRKTSISRRAFYGFVKPLLFYLALCGFDTKAFNAFEVSVVVRENRKVMLECRCGDQVDPYRQ